MNPQTNQKPTKNQPKIHQNGSKISLGGCLGRLLGPLGASWAHLGAKMAPRAKNVARRTPQDPPTWERKSTQNQSGGHPKSDNFFDCFWDRVWVPFGRNLAPSWPPKPSQHRAKLAPRSIKNWIKMRPLFCLIFDRPGIVFANFASKLDGRGSKKLFKV